MIFWTTCPLLIELNQLAMTPPAANSGALPLPESPLHPGYQPQSRKPLNQPHPPPRINPKRWLLSHNSPHTDSAPLAVADVNQLLSPLSHLDTMQQPLTSQNLTTHSSQNYSSRLVTPHTTAVISAISDGSISLLSIPSTNPHEVLTSINISIATKPTIFSSHTCSHIQTHEISLSPSCLSPLVVLHYKQNLFKPNTPPIGILFNWVFKQFVDSDAINCFVELGFQTIC